MRGKPRYFLILAGLALGAQSPPEYAGRWYGNVFETGTAIELGADGRFTWFFSQGSLDMMGEGRWTREGDGSIHLTSDPPVNVPRFALIDRRRDEGQSGILVRVADAANATPSWLEPIAEYADGDAAIARFFGGEYLFEPEPGRRIVAVQVVSEVFGFASDRYPVAPGDVVSLRFFANDLGRWNFAGERATIENGRLSLIWRGTPLYYVREAPPTTEEEALAMAEAQVAASTGAATEAEPVAAMPDMDALPAPGPVEAWQPPMPIRRPGPPSGPFRPGEQVETGVDDQTGPPTAPERFQVHRGTIDGAHYSYRTGADGFVQSGIIDGPAGEDASEDENGLVPVDPDEWWIGVIRGRPPEADQWFIDHGGTGMRLEMGMDGHVARFCLLTSNYPDRAHRLIVGSHAPIRVPPLCTAAGAALLETRFMAGGPVVVEAYHWAVEETDRHPASADLFAHALELLAFLQNHRP